MKRVVIIGGGVAGLSAAVRLVEAGDPVTLLEARSFCGGRTYSYPAPVIGDIVDNGQHLLLGCYSATLDYLSRIGSRQHLDCQKTLRIPFTDGKKKIVLQCPSLPPPFNLLAGLFKFPEMSVRDLFSLVRHRGDILGDYIQNDQLSCSDWFNQRCFSKKSIEKFWEPLVLAIMNDAPDRISAAPFLHALSRILQGPASNAALCWSRVGLSDLLVNPAVQLIQSRGGIVQTGSPVQSLKVVDGNLVAVNTRKGEEISGDAFVFALPPRDLHAILAEVPGTIVVREILERFETSPILSVYLWFDRPVMDEPVLGLWGSPFHWAFCRHAIVPSSVYGVSLVVSGAHNFHKMDRDTVVEDALLAMNHFFPKSREAKLIHRLVSREIHATVRLAPGSQRLRQAAQLPWKNAVLAGDWCNTRLPATIEGAIESGFTAASQLACVASTR